MANVFYCDIVVSEFEFQESNYLYFRINTLGKVKKSLIPPTVVKIVLMEFLYNGLALDNP